MMALNILGLLETGFEIGNGLDLAGAQAVDVQFRQMLQALAQCGFAALDLLHRISQGFRAEEAEHFTGARVGIKPIGKAGDDAGAFIHETQRFLIVNPFERGMA